MRSRITAWRRWVAAGALTLTVGLLAACGGSSSSNDSKAPTSARGPIAGTLTFYNFQPTGNEGRWWDDFVARFEAKYPRTHIKVTKYATQDYWIKTLAAFSSGNEPDIFIPDAGEDLNKYIRAGRIAPLDRILDLSYYNRAAVEPFRAINGHVNAIPIFSYEILGWANEDLLAKNGLTVPRTWDELLNACGKLSAAGVVPLAMGNAGQDRFPTEHLMDTLLYQLAGNRAALNATYGVDGASWTDDAVVRAGAAMRQLIDARCFPEGFTGLSYAQMTNLFAQGKAAMTFTGSWFAAQVQTSRVKFRSTTFPFPDVPGATHSTANLDGILGGVTGLTASGKAANRNPALVAAFLNEFGKRVDDYANATGALSVAASPNPTGGTLQRDMAEVFKSVGELVPVSDTILPKPITEAYEGDIVSLTAGKLTPEAWAKSIADTTRREQANLPRLDG